MEYGISKANRLPRTISKKSARLSLPTAPIATNRIRKDGIRILYRAFHTTKESRREKQPHISFSEAVITWDGQLDNRAELISELRDSATVNSTDVDIVAAAYEEWGANCLGKLIGDWALSIWNPRERSVLLAKDPSGTRHLYYSFDNNQVTWSTILDPLVRFAGKTFSLNEEYVAGWFAMIPGRAFDSLRWRSFRSTVLVLCISGGESTRSASIGISTHPKQRVIAPMPNTKNTSARFSERPSSANSVPIRHPCRTERRQGLLRRRLHGRYDHRPRHRRAPLASIPSPTMTTLNPTGTSAPISPKWKKRGRAGWHVNVGAQDPGESPGLNYCLNLLTAASYQLPATMAALLRKSAL